MSIVVELPTHLSRQPHKRRLRIIQLPHGIHQIAGQQREINIHWIATIRGQLTRPLILSHDLINIALRGELLTRKRWSTKRGFESITGQPVKLKPIVRRK
jgi:hypothetical protein